MTDRALVTITFLYGNASSDSRSAVVDVAALRALPAPEGFRAFNQTVLELVKELREAPNTSDRVVIVACCPAVNYVAPIDENLAAFRFSAPVAAQLRIPLP